jgi:class 3 adenylate cyclase
MDLHKLEAGTTAEDLARAHMMDLEVQGKFGVKYLTYWFNEAAGKVFCLADAPSVNAAVAVHREAHGVVADEIIEVEAGAVQGFLGKVEETSAAKEPSKPVEESAFRTILFTDMEGSTTVTQRLGDSRAMELLRTHDTIIRDALTAVGGNEVKHTGDGIMACFVSVAPAVESSIAVQRGLAAHNEDNADNPIRVRIGLSAGEPVEEHRDLFGAAVQMAARICRHAEPGRILVSNVIRELAVGKGFQFADRGEIELRGFDDPVRLHEVSWREDD